MFQSARKKCQQIVFFPYLGEEGYQNTESFIWDQGIQVQSFEWNLGLHNGADLKYYILYPGHLGFALE